MHTDSLWETQQLPFHVEGTIGIPEPAAYTGQLLYDADASQITVQECSAAAQLQLFDPLGRLLVQQRVIHGEVVSVERLVPGVYVAVVSDAHGDPMIVERIVRQ